MLMEHDAERKPKVGSSTAPHVKEARKRQCAYVELIATHTHNKYKFIFPKKKIISFVTNR